LGDTTVCCISARVTGLRTVCGGAFSAVIAATGLAVAVDPSVPVDVSPAVDVSISFACRAAVATGCALLTSVSARVGRSVLPVSDNVESAIARLVSAGPRSPAATSALIEFMADNAGDGFSVGKAGVFAGSATLAAREASCGADMPADTPESPKYCGGAMPKIPGTIRLMATSAAIPLSR